jgi:hypothetical protein
MCGIIDPGSCIRWVLSFDIKTRYDRLHVTACPHILQTLTVLPAHTSCRPMMALTTGTLKTYACALETCQPSYIGQPSRIFLMFEGHGPQGTAVHVAARSPPCREAGSEAIGYAAHRSPPSGSRVTVHMVASETFLSGRQDMESLDTWQPQSPPWLRGRVWYCRTYGDAWVHVPLLVLTWSLYIKVPGL